MKEGRFIAIEGADGTGKSSLATNLITALEERGIKTLRTRQPGGTVIGEDVRGILMQREPCPTTEVLLFAASFSQCLHEIILPALSEGVWVISDRWTHSTLAYQCGGRGLSRDPVSAALELASTRKPDAHILCETAEGEVERRLGERRGRDRFELAGKEFDRRVVESFRQQLRSSPTTLVLDTGCNPPEKCKELALEFVMGLDENTGG